MWRRLTGRELPYVGCCHEHDYAYYSGGTWADRREADRQLRLCVAGQGYAAWAWVMWVAVRIFGSPWLPTPWGKNYIWGFGLPRWINRIWSRAVPEELDHV